MTRPKTGRLLLFWDFDTQWGADRSRSGKGARSWGHLEFVNTERLLPILSDFQVPSCFAVVGAAAMKGERPYHDPGQVRSIHQAGHEVGSHSFQHDWLPGLNPVQLKATLLKSRQALEDCIGASVVTFVPPYNQPFDFPRGLSFSRSERREAGPERTGFSSLCRALYETGFRFCRAAYRPMPQRILEIVLGRPIHEPGSLKLIHGITCVRLNTSCGFGEQSRAMLRKCAEVGGYAVVYGHPHSLSSDGPQSFEALAGFLEVAMGLIRRSELEVVLPGSLLIPSASGREENSYVVPQPNR